MKLSELNWRIQQSCIAALSLGGYGIFSYNILKFFTIYLRVPSDYTPMSLDPIVNAVISLSIGIICMVIYIRRWAIHFNLNNEDKK